MRKARRGDLILHPFEVARENARIYGFTQVPTDRECEMFLVWFANATKNNDDNRYDPGVQIQTWKSIFHSHL